MHSCLGARRSATRSLLIGKHLNFEYLRTKILQIIIIKISQLIIFVNLFNFRNAAIRDFCEVIRKPVYGALFPVRAKQLLPLNNDLTKTLRLHPVILKNGDRSYGYYPCESVCPGQSGTTERFYYIPNKVLFLKLTADRGSRNLSKSTASHYCFNSRNDTKMSDRRALSAAYANFMETSKTRMEWPWLTDRKLSVQFLNEKIQQTCNQKKLKS